MVRRGRKCKFPSKSNSDVCLYFTKTGKRGRCFRKGAKSMKKDKKKYCVGGEKRIRLVYDKDFTPEQKRMQRRIYNQMQKASDLEN